MARNFNAAPLLGKLAILVDQEGATLDAQVLFAVHFLEFDHIKQLTNGFVFVGNQRKVEILLGFEVFLGAQTVPGDTDDHGVGSIEGRKKP